VDSVDPSTIHPDVFPVVEADTFWCLMQLLSGIQVSDGYSFAIFCTTLHVSIADSAVFMSVQDNYTTDQPGIQRQVAKLRDLVSRIDGTSSDTCLLVPVRLILTFLFYW
jgi:hypothetical protein